MIYKANSMAFSINLIKIEKKSSYLIYNMQLQK